MRATSTPSVIARRRLLHPDADLFRTPPPDEMFVALVIDPTLTRPAATEVLLAL